MAEEKISVVVAIYNKENCLRRCIESLMAQTYLNLQIILVDDDSTDDSGKICHEYADKDDRIIYTCHPHNLGISEVRNTGIRFASGKYLSFIDGDDYVLEDFIETLYKNLSETGADISACEYIRIGEEETPDEPPKDRISVEVYEDPLSFMMDAEWATAVVVWNKLYKTDLFNEIRFPANRIHQDEFIIHRLIAASKKLVYTDIPLYVYVRHEESVMRTQTPSTFYDGCLALSDRIDMLDEKGRLEERDLWIQRLMGLLLTYYENSKWQDDADLWQPVFKQRLMMLIRKYPGCAEFLDGGQRAAKDIILNMR